ncbi:MAG: LysR family transcriptional regulator [Eggerthellaceae bacterium]|nr:LysR family transcriptional regulator [Eggerthellaceae bacterium]
MNIDYIREFIVLAETLNFTKAASRLYCSQPALSKHIAAIEHELGAELVERGEGRVALTPIGSIYLDEARRIVRDYDRSLAIIEDAKKAQPMQVRIES